MIRAHLAGAKAVVSESKPLLDSVTGQLREVDVVVEPLGGSEHLTISIEVYGRTRPATVEWVEQQICKHEDLPTNLLVLVSWPGFTTGARRKIQSRLGKVALAVPELPKIDGQPAAELFTVEEVTPAQVHRVMAMVSDPTSEGRAAVRLIPGSALFYEDGRLCGTASDLMEVWMASAKVSRGLADEVMRHPDRAEMTSFTMAVRLPERLYLHADVGDDRHLVEEIQADCGFTLTQTTLRLQVIRIFGSEYLGGPGVVGGRDVVWVAPRDPETGMTTSMSWKWLP